MLTGIVPMSAGRADKVQIIFDGGAIGNPGRGYGSFVVRGAVQTDEPQRIEFPGRTTNNEAEYMTLHNALEATLDALRGNQIAPTSVRVQVFSDSKLVVEQVSGRWKVKQPHLLPLVNQARSLLGEFGGWKLTWHSRNESVKVLGH